MNQSKEIKYLTVRFGVIPELYDEMEKQRLAAPRAERLNRSAFVRKALYEYLKNNQAKKTI